MAKGTGSAVLPDGSYDQKLSRLFLKEIEKVLDTMASKQGEYMAWCRGERERIAEIYDRAKDAGIPKKVLREHVKRRVLQEKLAGCGEFEDIEDTTKYQQMYLALEDEVPEEIRKSLKSASRPGKGLPGADAPATH